MSKKLVLKLHFFQEELLIANKFLVMALYLKNSLSSFLFSFQLAFKNSAGCVVYAK